MCKTGIVKGKRKAWNESGNEKKAEACDKKKQGKKINEKKAEGS